MTPRELFISTPTKLEHQKWVESGTADVATQAAMMEFVQQFPDNLSQPMACDCFNQIEGAKKFCRILLEIHKAQEPAKRQVWPSLKPPQ